MKVLKKIIKFSLISFVLLLVSYLGLYVYAKLTPKLSIEAANGLYIYDNKGETFSGYNDEWIELDQMSKHIINATLAIEDKHFYKHIGFDYLRIVKALATNFQTGTKNQGASTITQQYAKNLFLDFDKKWSRKIEEAWLTIKLESHYSKDELLEGYLNSINYGGVFGIENASYYYFGVSASDLTLSQASILAGIPKNPSKYSPIVDMEASKNRQATILNSMVKNNFINDTEKKSSYDAELNVIGKLKKNSSSTLMYYQDAVMNELNHLTTIPKSLIETGGLKIYTNLDLELQLLLEKNLNKELGDKPDLQTSSIVAEPTTGKVLALIGGRDYSKSQFNRAISAKRQVGSTIKPFLYYAALENGFTASTTFTSSKTTFVFSNNQTYSPKNYADIYGNKEISMAAAIAYSDNIYAVKTHLFLGEENLVNIAARVGMKSELVPNPSLALGTSEMTLVDMIRGYSTLANLGDKINVHLIEKVEDMNGNTLYECKEESENVLNKSSVYILNELLNNCYSDKFIDYNYPTCINISTKLKNKYSIKTGTTDTDNLLFGYNPNIIMGIWAGYDDNKPTTVSIGSNIRNVFADTVEKYAKNHETTWYEMPSNVVGSLVNPISGKSVTKATNKSTMFYYIRGTEPTIKPSDLENLIPTIKEQ